MKEPTQPQAGDSLHAQAVAALERICAPGVGYGRAVCGSADRICYVLDEMTECGQLYAGEVIASGVRPDGEILWVVAQKHWIAPEIAGALAAWEPDVPWICYYEHSAGVLLCTWDGEWKFLITESASSGHIAFPKGHLENTEDLDAAIQRELYEEVHITQFTRIDGFRQDGFAYTAKGMHKDLTYFLGVFNLADNEIRLQAEEISRYWLAPYAQALELVNTPFDRYVVEQANQKLRTL